MQIQPECRERLDAGVALPALQTTPSNRWLRRPGAWIGVGALVGVAMGVTLSLAPLTTCVNNDPGLAAWIIIIGTGVGLVLGLLSGITMAVIAWCAPEYASHLSTAATVGGMIGTLTAVITRMPFIGWVVGSGAGFSAAIWVTNPTRLPLEELLPLRGRWLRLAVTGLLIALTPFIVNLGLSWRPGCLQR